MNRAAMRALLALALLTLGCGSSEEEPTNGNTNADNTMSNNSNGSTNGGTNTGSNNSVPTAGDCAWGEFIATCGGGNEPTLTPRAVGCTEYYSPSDPAGVTEEALCTGQIWQEDPCSPMGISGRRPVGCCFELDEEASLYSKHCFYDDPANIEGSAEKAQSACEDAGFCWVPAEMI